MLDCVFQIVKITDQNRNLLFRRTHVDYLRFGLIHHNGQSCDLLQS